MAFVGKNIKSVTANVFDLYANFSYHRTWHSALTQRRSEGFPRMQRADGRFITYRFFVMCRHFSVGFRLIRNSWNSTSKVVLLCKNGAFSHHSWKTSFAIEGKQAFTCYSACRRRGGVLNSPRFWFFSFYFFRCQKSVQRSWVIPLAQAA